MENYFVGTTPSALGNITSLKKIDLSYNKLSGSIDSTIFNLSSLQIIDLSHNRLGGNLPADMANRLPELKELYLSGNQLYGQIPSSLFNCRQLKELSLSSNSFTGNISINLGNLTMLKDLDLSTNNFEGMPDCLFESDHFSLNTDSAIPSEIGLFLPNLLELQLRGNKIQGTIPSSIANASKLTLLDLADNSFTGPIPMKIGDLKALVEIDLSNNQLSGHIPDSIEDLKNLAYLSLAVNRLQGPIPQFLGLSVALEFLDLSRNNLSGVIPKSLENLRYLIYFNVSFNQLEGEIPGGGSFANFTAQSYLMNKALCGAARLQVRHCRTGKRSWKTLLKRILLPEIASICILSLIYKVIKHCLEKEKDPLLKTNRTILYQEIVLATDGFSESNLLGTGSSGSVYKGTMKEEKNVAIKVESNLLTKVGHPNLVKLMYSCCDDDFRALVLEYMPNGTLDKWLYTHNYFLNLLQRLDIMIEVASAMSYLHSEHIIHCDLKPSNVLLDEDMVARVSDFSIAKLLDGRDAAVQTGTMATIGYMAPEYGLSGIVSEKTDVYSFGILLMETFTGKKPTDDIFNEEMNLRRWIFESLPHAVDRIIDVTLLQRDQEDVAAKARCIKSIMELACFCTADSFSERKTMAEVDIELHRIKSHFLTDAKLIEEIQRALHPGILFGEFEVAIDGFSEINMLYSGKSNSVFRGSWKDHVVEIKNFNLQKRGLKSFEVHCQALSFIRHRNIVRVLAYCSDNEFNALLVEYMPNGSLQNYLHPGMNIFNFQQRLDIMINVASALSYLHSMRVIHCNLNPTNVLLDEDMVTYTVYCIAC
ncbi:putative LRR receptor-like serine/threonine-protein kinase [Gossypium australe]|uniref:non-specific serine/threonine protein kinase n=1 Tax=Gossypium australe TaxID=47621 RepID=A0A5B6WIZ6_9ROSI|nr:putative LRR receptor-like serine/threonine-protein kinase [Gossypium australe]